GILQRTVVHLANTIYVPEEVAMKAVLTGRRTLMFGTGRFWSAEACCRDELSRFVEVSQGDGCGRSVQAEHQETCKLEWFNVRARRPLEIIHKKVVTVTHVPDRE
ncbi:hypothetical protein FOZ62_009834, partial [Perkinsus olseni]